MGLEDLVDLTMNLLPEAVRSAFVASQRVSLKIKQHKAHAAVGLAATAAAAIGGSPVPFSNTIALIPIQIGMLATISAMWGIPVSQMFLGTIVSGTLTSSAGTIGGRVLAGTLLKFIPGVGTAVGAVITAGVAGTITTAFGEAYIATLYTLTKDNPDRIPMPEENRDEFQRKHRRRLATWRLAAYARKIRDEFQRQLKQSR